MTTEQEPKLTLEEKAEILRENGINVVNCFDEDGDFYRAPAIQLNGSDDDALRAAEIMVEHGVDVYSLKRVWTYGPGAKTPKVESWSLEFYR